MPHALRAVLCREEAIKVWKLRDKLDGMGVSIAALLHERIPDEVRPCKLPRRSCVLHVASSRVTVPAAAGSVYGSRTRSGSAMRCC